MFSQVLRSAVSPLCKQYFKFKELQRDIFSSKFEKCLKILYNLFSVCFLDSSNCLLAAFYVASSRKSI